MPIPKYLRQLSILTLFLTVAVWTAHFVYSSQEAEHSREFEKQTDALANRIESQMQRLFIAIDGVRGFASTHPALSAAQFRDYLDSADFFTQFPAVRAIAYAPRISADDLPMLQRRLFKDAEREHQGYPAFKIEPEGARAQYFPAVLVEPREGNDNVYGFDLWAHKLRRAAAERARDSGQPILSAPVTLSQDKASGLKGVLLLSPVYSAGISTLNTRERRDAHIGFIPVGLTIAYALQHIFDADTQNQLYFSLHDSGRNTGSAKAHLTQLDLLYSSFPEGKTPIGGVNTSNRATISFDIAGRSWQLITERRQPLHWTDRYIVPILILLLGLTLAIGAIRLLEDLLLRWQSAHEKLRFAESEVNAFFDMSVDMFCVIGFDGYFKQINPAWVETLKFEQDYLLTTPLRELIHPDDLQRSNVEMVRLQRGEQITDFRNRYRTYKGDYRWLSWRGTASPDDQLIFAVARDVTSKMENEERIQKLAYFDSLTDLANRSHFLEQLNREISQAARRQSPLAIFYIDLDGFKDVNDSLGHDAGDQLLQEVAARLKQQLRSSDFAARLGGDEFCILINDLSDNYSATSTAQRVLNEISKPVILGTRTLTPRASIGIAYFPDDGSDSNSLMKAADSAMYSAKNAGKHRYACYQPHMTAEAMERLQLEQDLRQAITNNELELHYQPQICLNSGTLKGVEALVRWRHPEKGLIMPQQFIETAERLRIIDALGEWVLKTALAQTVRWHETSKERFTIAVNISPLHFEDEQLLTTVNQALEASGLPPEYLELEITETRILQTKAGQANATALRQMGVHVAVDDFGTGYSSLTLLQDLDIDTIKIDRSFIAPLADKPEAAILLGTIVGAAHAFGAKVIAEGVETLDQARILHGVGCDLVQGYYFCRPVPALELPATDQSLYPDTSTAKPVV
ncbi:EAL domain-containing protein [Pontibacterium sp.]|uniref:bifunctional diguanylate cyclase/phosphodiesterase n=1 Tax=Pontibacterium sp. TaxID=2036026 RepID=UPI0035671984